MSEVLSDGFATKMQCQLLSFAEIQEKYLPQVNQTLMREELSDTVAPIIRPLKSQNATMREIYTQQRHTIKMRVQEA
jgi:hypothetical protein